MPALPKIEIIRKGRLYEVHWDYQEAPESKVLHRNNEVLTAFIDGALYALDISDSNVSCASGRCGAVKKLDEQTAAKLAKALEHALHPSIIREHERLQREADLPPHLRRDRFESADTE
ncbi:hypothetical protein NLO95_13155 [Pseudomonas syringae]|nr:hypothetical protein [Pseudomonas syringae]